MLDKLFLKIKNIWNYVDHLEYVEVESTNIVVPFIKAMDSYLEIRSIIVNQINKLLNLLQIVMIVQTGNIDNVFDNKAKILKLFKHQIQLVKELM